MNKLTKITMDLFEKTVILVSKEEIMRNFVSGIAIVFIAIFVASGCSKSTNIFGWTHSGGSSSATPAVLVSDGDSAYAAGDNVKAMENYDKAVTAEPKSSLARVGYVKAYVKNAGLDLASLIKNASGQQKNTGAPSAASMYPVVGFVQSVVDAQGGYYLINDVKRPFGVNLPQFEGLVTVIIKYLGPIADGTCDAGILATNPVININLCFAHFLRGILWIVDNDYNATIDYNFFKGNDGTTSIVRLNPDGTVAGKVKLGDSIPGVSKALGSLDKSLGYLLVAIDNSQNSTSSLWVSVRKQIVDVRTQVASYSEKMEQ